MNELSFLLDVQRSWSQLIEHFEAEGFDGFRYITPGERISPVMLFPTRETPQHRRR
jgi:hypothetical protein